MVIEHQAISQEEQRKLIEPYQLSVEEHIADKDQESLMKSFSSFVDKSTHPTNESVTETGCIHAPCSRAPRHWYRHKLSNWVYKHVAVPTGFKLAVEKKFGNFIVIRETGQLHYEEMPIYTRIGMHILFNNYYADSVADTTLMHSLFAKETIRQGHYFDQPESVKSIPSFVHHYCIDMDNYAISDLNKYKTFNEFFTRAILPSKRPIADPNDDNVIVSSADCRLNVFDSIDAATTFWIKGKEFSLSNLLQDQSLAKKLEGGSLAIFRLAPQDYHRFHIPTKGEIKSIQSISGTYYTGKQNNNINPATEREYILGYLFNNMMDVVNPCVVTADINVFTENHRNRIIIESHHGFEYVLVSIGALLVGSIVLTNAKEGERLEKGQEMGYFQYGGSTVITIFPKDTVTWDKDLLKNSQRSLETLVMIGEQIGVYNNI
ncbi:phosphatidylserine decarboxylase-domain-containing protein [Cokeromyces recurvatus]|uniref:phosphatidylserine decarboxylase-domain-containing protein n=1 Tax=Cokeromyces recurvatus TaxID=90255 RepID=UPI00221FB418|nr:phosphatidylserine decarboxylase-domain-containing protein [Cokeromyces recurvatus]KAI7901152.1 phosphatidylserine decarboxylase-domain-containing protein [Cokeromyces recurvatus]